MDTASDTYYVYVLYSLKDDEIYIWQANNLEIRLEKHNAGKVKSTKAYIPWSLLHFEEFDSRAEAMRHERQLESHQGREFIRKLISVGRGRQQELFLYYFYTMPNTLKISSFHSPNNLN